MKPKLYVCLDKVRSAFNVGSVFRSCDSAGVEKLYLTGWTACPPNNKLLKTALGSTDSVVWEHHCEIDSLIYSLKKQNLRLVSLETGPNTKSIYDAHFQDDTCLFFGNEVDGVSEKVLNVSEEVLSIPQFGLKESLNIAVAAGIAIYEFRRKIL